MTGQPIYRDVWWRHDRAGRRDPLLAQVEPAQMDDQNKSPSKEAER